MTFRSKGVTGKRWKDVAASSSSPEAFATEIIPDIVDSTIAQLLGAIDHEVLPLSFTAANEKSVDLVTATDGLSGLYGAEWCKKYTKERFIDNLADLKGLFDKPPKGDRSRTAERQRLGTARTGERSRRGVRAIARVLSDDPDSPVHEGAAPMTIARAHLVDVSVTRWYHCVARCVRRAFLLGEGDFDRKEWIDQRVIPQGVFALG
jgi:hypothetical protein